VSEFYLASGLLILVAIVIASFPWWAGGLKPQRNTLSNTQLIRQRLEELNSEQQQGLLDEDSRQQAEKELKLALLDEAKPIEFKNSSTRLALILGMVISVGVAGGVYLYANHIQELENWQAAIERLPELGKRIVVEGDPSIQVEDLQDFALGLRSRLAEKPDDSTGWMLLGRVFSAVNRLDSAVEAYNRSLQIDPSNTGTLVSYSQALMMMNQEHGIRQANGMLQRVLVLEPDNTNAMGMLALVAAQLGDKGLAIENWKKLKTFVPPSDPSYASIEQRIAQLSGDEPQNTAQVDESPTKSTTVISINIDLDDALKNKLPSDGFLFVFAQDASGAVRMPAAVVKTMLADLPIIIELSDANAMMPTYKLSQLNEARLVARISADENVATATGELQGEVLVTVKPGTSSQQNIMINKELM
jgi:cytochrome c-type biogenesis protein CcmI